MAVKVRSLVNVFRKRVKRRSQTTRRQADDASFCRDIEREAYIEIDRYLGRKPRHSNAEKFREGANKAVGGQDNVTRVGAASSRERPKAKRYVTYRLESQLRCTVSTISTMADMTKGH